MQINCVKFIFSLSVIFICAWQVNGYLAVGIKRVTRDANNDSELVLPENVNGTVAATAQGIISQIFSLIGNIFGLSRVTPGATCQCSCGEANSAPRVVGGKETQPNEYPWMARLLYFGRFYCGASLINDRYVLTAAHCVNGFIWFAIRVTFGEHNRCSSSNSPVSRYVVSVNSPLLSSFPNLGLDIALLRLNDRVPFNSFIRPICLPNKPVSDYAGKNSIVAGWGMISESNKTSCTLQAVRVPIMSNADCFENTNYKNVSDIFAVDNMMCAGYPEGGADSCQGDSGGPLMVQNNNKRYELVGVVSFGLGCARPNYPGVYTRVTRYLDWIKANTNDGCYCQL